MTRKKKNKRLFCYTLVCLFLTLPAPCQADSQLSSDEARRLESGSDFKQAIAAYERLWQSNPSDQTIKDALIWTWRQWNYRNPADPEIVLGWGQELQRMKEYDLALHEYYWAKWISPQHSSLRADELIAGCNDALAGEQQAILRMVPMLPQWLATLKSQLEEQWQTRKHSGTYEIKVEFGPSGRVKANEERKSCGDVSENGTIAGLLNQMNMQSLPGGLHALSLECNFNFKKKSVNLLVSGLGTEIQSIVVEPIDSATLKKLLEEKGLNVPSR